jgi:Flp pilus assembly protein TadD
MCVMAEDLYERYKDALRTGHVAVLRGSLEEAAAAYRIAAEIAPSRALPHTSLGGVLLRLGHLEEALAEFAAAVSRSPHDEGALLGQAEALTTAGMRSDAASALDHVAEIQEASGRLPEAADTLRRAIELEEAVERTRHQRALLREIRLAAGDQAAEQLLARALRLRDEPGGKPRRPGTAEEPEAEAYPPQPESGGPTEAEAPPQPDAEPSVAESVVEAEAQPDVEVAPEAEALLDLTTAPAEVEIEPETETEPVTAAALLEEEAEAAEAIVTGVMEGVPGSTTMDLPGVPGLAENEPQPSGDELLAAAEAADLAGDHDALRSLLIWTSRAYAREGRFEAALDAVHRLLLRYPGDVDGHLVLVELYVARSWDAMAVEKLKLLDRLAELSGDQETHDRLCDAVTRAFPDDPTLAQIRSRTI